MPERRRLPIWTLIIALLIGLAGAGFYRINPVSDRAANYATSVALAGAGTYVTLRSLNAVLSSVQEIEVGGSLVVSGSARPLKFLEPVDDTVERISDVVFAIMLLAGTLSVAMGPVSAVGFGMVAFASVIWIADRVVGARDPVIGLARRLLWFGLFLGVGLQLAFLLSASVADQLTDATWAEHQAIIDEIMAEVDAAEVTNLPDDTGWGGWLRGVSEDAERYREVVGNIFDRADDLVRSFIAILSVYVFRIFLLPGLMAGAIYLIVRHFAREG